MNHVTILNQLSFKTSGKLLTCAFLVALADMLFYDHPIGWTFGLFGVVLLMAMQVHKPAAAQSRLVAITSYAMAGLVLALIETPSFLAVTMYGFSIIALSLLTKLNNLDDTRVILRSVLRYIFTGWARLYRDGIMMSYIGKRRRKGQRRSQSIVRHWALPLGMSLIFVLLFAQANPIIMHWADAIDLRYLWKYLSVWRLLFWMSVACVCWALIRPRFKQRSPALVSVTKQSFTLTNLLFNERSIFLSLVVFNGLFLVQNAMDIAFLWTGAKLPDGMTHAQYAHQGAYPLIVTALLAALFVLIALKPGSVSEQMASIRALVYAWVGQNILLVFSSIIRLTDYIEMYSLTYLRVSALIWMLLVAFGLALIVARIYFGRSNRWLINTNSLTLYTTLYLCCFINFGSIIADYNVKHCREITGSGASLDVHYLRNEIGSAAIPALIWFEAHHAASSATQPAPSTYLPATDGSYYDAPRYTSAVDRVSEFRRELQQQANTRIQNWRAWTFREYRIARAAGV